MQQIVAAVDDGIEPAAKSGYRQGRIAEAKAQEDDRQNGTPKLIAVQTTYTGDHHYQAFGSADYVANQKNGKSGDRVR